MAALASLATVVGAGASIYGGLRQAQLQHATNQAQIQVAAQENTARQQVLQAQASQEALARQQQLDQAIATGRAQLAAAGVSPDSGSAADVAGGLTERSAAAQAASDATLRTRLAQGPISLLAPDNTATALLQSGPSFGFASRNLLT